MNFQFEMTDTFAGEANYSWVKRKSWAGISGQRCKVDHYDSVIAIKPCKWPVVIFISESLM
jgi:hypothetical protein